MVEGTENAVELLVCRVTAAPPAGAIPLTVTLTVANPPDGKLDGAIETELSARVAEEGFTAIVAF